jgi:plasmid stability protein
MAIQITIRNVPEGVRSELAARAAREHKSMQEYLLEALERLAAKPTVDSWRERVRERKAVSPAELSVASLLDHRHADRR